MHGNAAAFRFGFGPGKEGFSPFDAAAELGRLEGAHPPSPDETPQRLAALRNHYRAVKEAKRARPSDAARIRLNAELRQYLFRDTHAAIVTAAATDMPFAARLSAFWANHFSLGLGVPQVQALAGPFEADAIRPRIMGHFADLLIAAELHPAMVFYLNLQVSVGPNSPLGKRRGRGLNENLGREILELHTLGADGGYSQRDVTALAAIMTGWFVNLKRAEVVFARNRAEPGSKTLLDREFAANSDGKEFADALRMLAAHPSTARHIARKLTRHFLGPSTDRAAAKLARVFRDSGGYLPAVYYALLDLAEASAPLGALARNDFEFLVSALRAARLRPGALELKLNEDGGIRHNPLTSGAMAALTQKLWRAPSPQGWPDDPGFWLAPATFARRLRWIPALVRHMAETTPAETMEAALGPLATANTIATVKAASNRLEALGLVFASPEFNRR
ncbi:MAG: DUF1800 domain-containing protein [Hyphomicrobiales bacterium]